MVQIYNQSRHGRRFLFNIGETIDRGAECAEVERRRRVNRGAVNAEGVMCGEGVSPSPLEEESGEGAVPPPPKIFRFRISKW